MYLPLQPEPMAIQKSSARRQELINARFVFGHKEIPDHKEDGSHGDHEKWKSSVKI